MENMEKIVFKSRIDWWVWCLMIFSLVLVWVASIGTYWWLGLIYGVFFVVLWVVGIFGCWYAIEGDRLVVYQFFRPHYFPIAKIKEVKKTRGYLASAAMSARRVSIRFVDRSVMKSTMPLEISPKDRDAFIARLREVNPEIAVS